MNEALDFCKHPDVIKTVVDTINKVGAGSGGTRNISGNAHHHVLLEKTVAQLHGKERGLIFNSGYSAIVGVITAIVDGMRDCVILSEDFPHPSVLHGVDLARSNHQTFPRNDMVRLEEHLKTLSNHPKLLIVPTLSSDDGTLLNLEAICDLKERYEMLIAIDESAALGRYGCNGGGYAQHLGLEHRIHLILGSFSGAFAGMGGYIASTEITVDYIRSFASGFIFTTSIPPALAMGALKAIELARCGMATSKATQHDL